MQLRFQTSKIILDFKKASNSAFKLLTLKIINIYILKTRVKHNIETGETEIKAALNKYVS